MQFAISSHPPRPVPRREASQPESTVGSIDHRGKMALRDRAAHVSNGIVERETDNRGYSGFLRERSWTALQVVGEQPSRLLALPEPFAEPTERAFPRTKVASSRSFLHKAAEDGRATKLPGSLGNLSRFAAVKTLCPSNEMEHQREQRYR
jgi:hypothetical protein